MASAMCYGLDGGGGFEVGDGAGNFQDAIVGAGGQPLLGHGPFQEALAVSGELAEGADVTRGHLGVAVELHS